MDIGRHFCADSKRGLGARSGVAISDKRFDNFGHRSGAEREYILPAAENVGPTVSNRATEEVEEPSLDLNLSLAVTRIPLLSALNLISCLLFPF
jgi:hypothetical protein